MQVWEKAGCNLAVVHGTMPVEALYAANDRLKANGGSSNKIDVKPGDGPTAARAPRGKRRARTLRPQRPHRPASHTRAAP